MGNVLGRCLEEGQCGPKAPPVVCGHWSLSGDTAWHDMVLYEALLYSDMFLSFPFRIWTQGQMPHQAQIMENKYYKALKISFGKCSTC